MKVKKNFILLGFILILGLLLAGCGGQDAGSVNTYNNEGYYADDNMAANDNDAAFEPEESEDAAHDASSPAVQQRIVIMNGEMTVESYDPEEIVGFITSLTERYGGYIIESRLEDLSQEEGKPVVQGYIKVRVPAERLNDAIAEIEAQQLEVIYKTVSGEDVTADYVDLQSRLRNLEEAATQLEAIMENATDTEAVLSVYQELIEVNEEAEVIRGQIQYYDDASAMSALAVRVNQKIDAPEPTPTPTPEPWSLSPTFERSGERLKRNFQYWLEDVVAFFYGLPIFILRVGPWLVAFYFIGRWVFRKVFKRGKKANEAEAKTPENEKKE